jgi:DnaB-like helicase C terminal domain
MSVSTANGAADHEARFRDLLTKHAQKMAAGDYAGAAEALRRLAELTAPPRAWRTTEDRARGLVSRQTPRIPTGCPTLDEALRGGWKARTVTMLLGPPGAGKTTLLVQQGVLLARSLVHVALVAADEDGDGLLIRVGQQLGLVRDDLDDGVAEACETLAVRIAAELPYLYIVDASEEGESVDTASMKLSKRAGGAPSALLCDSLQTLRAIGSETADSPRTRVDAVVAAHKTAAKAGHIVLGTSEVGRGFYRSRRKDEQIDPLSAGKESGGIEYGAHVQLVMQSVQSQNGLADVFVAKNRIGKTGLSFRLAQDFRRATFAEIPQPDAGDEDGGADQREQDAARDRGIEEVKAKLVPALLRARRPPTSRRDLASLARDVSHVRNAYVEAAISQLLEEGLLVGGNGKPYGVVQASGKESAQ